MPWEATSAGGGEATHSDDRRPVTTSWIRGRSQRRSANIGSSRTWMPAPRQEVYRAIHPGLQHDVVVKLARGSYPVGHSLRDRLPAEGRVLAELEHPGLARVYDLEFHGDRPYLVMEFVRGSRLNGAPPLASREPDRSGLPCGGDGPHSGGRSPSRRVASGCEAKEHPGRRIRAAATDRFRTGSRRDRLEPDHPPLEGLSGTIPYMAPEQVAGDPASIALSDLYGLGGVLFFLLVGQAPLAGDSLRRPLTASGRRRMGSFSTGAAPDPGSIAANLPTRDGVRTRAAVYANAGEMAAELERFIKAARRRMRPRLRPAWAGTAAMSICVAGWWAFRSWVPGPTLVGELRTASEWDVARVQFRASHAEQQPASFVDLAEAVPLRTGDEVKIRVEVPRGFHAALLA